jgi:HEAT repeat protein
MRKFIPALLCVAVVFLPLVFAQAPQEAGTRPPPAQKFRELDKEINAKLRSQDPKEVLEALAAVQDINEFMQGSFGRDSRVENLCKHREPRVRLKAVQTIAEIERGSDNPVGAVRFFVKIADDRDPDVRAAVFYAIGQMGPDAKEAMPSVLVALKDKDGKIRLAAYFVISKLLRHDKKLIPHVIAALDDPYMGPDGSGLNSVSQMAFDDLHFLKTEGKDAAPKLIKIFESKKGSDDHRFHALWTLSILAPTEGLPLDVAKE